MESTSESLLFRLRSPCDDMAWSRFVDLYTPLIFYWARRSGMNSEDAADLVQEIFAVLVKKLPEFKYDPQKSFRSWLRTVTMNKRAEHLRRKSLTLVDATHSEFLKVPANSEDHFWQIEYQQQLVHRALELMRDEFEPQIWNACREFVTTKASAADVAKRTGVSIWAIYAAKSKLLRKLRQELEELLS